ncbi:DUF3450 domain-containing protein [Puniceicoccales bacterium CK1056]|uniref:DUF3450 domain-containing protein n=1 Tax=Oceanipulchritudo coccoides TaxID=2706888 RepID=A0A6B2LZJ1_9BACT|nr:DUF3450 family protein [Oceanipulchritudo coccoides]NDV62141.1 DUF3450 domain-containing protein [Oceanipulchritudo coccoides]
MAVNRFLKVALALSGAFFWVSASTAESPLEETVNTLEEWVETERLISDVKAEWEANKSSMENLISIYTQEIETLTELIEAAEKDTSAAETRRADLTEQDKAVKEFEAKVVEGLIAAETAMKGLQAFLPPPLQEELNPLFSTIPEDPKASKLSVGQRIQPIVAILTQVQKFNQVVTVVEGFREFEAGRTVQTESIYFGLGASYYVDQANEHAGVGVMGSDGWEWKDDDELVSAARNFVEIYRGTQQAKYVELPVSVN